MIQSLIQYSFTIKNLITFVCTLKNSFTFKTFISVIIDIYIIQMNFEETLFLNYVTLCISGLRRVTKHNKYIDYREINEIK